MAFENYSQFPSPPGVQSAATLTAASETVYMSTDPDVSVPPSPEGRVISGYINVTGGATGGAWSIKCRQGSVVGGAQVGNTQTYTMPATTTVSIPFSFNDLNGLAQQYCVTVTAAGSNGTANDGAISVRIPAAGGTNN